MWKAYRRAHTSRTHNEFMLWTDARKQENSLSLHAIHAKRNGLALTFFSMPLFSYSFGNFQRRNVIFVFVSVRRCRRFHSIACCPPRILYRCINCMYSLCFKHHTSARKAEDMFITRCQNPSAKAHRACPVHMGSDNVNGPVLTEECCRPYGRFVTGPARRILTAENSEVVGFCRSSKHIEWFAIRWSVWVHVRPYSRQYSYTKSTLFTFWPASCLFYSPIIAFSSYSY